MAHYVSVLVPVTTGGWRALLPDLPSYQAEETSLDLAILRASRFLAQVVQLGSEVPPPRPLALIKLDTEWASSRDIDWARSVVIMIQVDGKVLGNPVPDGSPGGDAPRHSPDVANFAAHF